MYTWRILLVIVLMSMLAACQANPEQIILTGRVVGHDGQPLPMARVSLDGRGVEGGGEKLVEADGTFSYTLDEPGPYYLWVSGVRHQSLLRPLYLDEPRHIDLDIRLAAPTYEERFDSVWVIGAFNDFDDDIGGRTVRLR